MDNSKVATKTDVKDLKTDVKDLKTDVKDLKTDTKFLRQEILKIEERVENLEEGQNRVEKKIDKIMDTLVGFVGTVDDLRTDNEVGTHHTGEIRMQVDDHEKRIGGLESSIKV